MLSVAQHTFVQPNKPCLEGIPASSWIITKTNKPDSAVLVRTLGIDHTPLPSSHGQAYSHDLGPNCSRWVPLQFFLIPIVSTQVPLVCTDLRPQSPWKASLAVWTKCPVMSQLGCISSIWVTVWQAGRQKCQLWFLLFPANAPEMLQDMMRETKSLRPLCGKQEFYCADRLRGDMFSKLWASIRVRRWVIYPPGGLCNQGFFAVYRLQEVRKTSQLQRNNLVTEFLPNPLQNTVTVTANLTEPSWRSVTFLSLQRATYRPQSWEFKANSRHTVNPPKIATLAPTRWSSCFCLCFYYCVVLHLLICSCWTTPASQRWSRHGHGEWSFWCVVGLGLSLFYWEFLHWFFSLRRLSYSSFWVCLCLVLGWV
jgi:hypothetical protein